MNLSASVGALLLLLFAASAFAQATNDERQREIERQLQREQERNRQQQAPAPVESAPPRVGGRGFLGVSIQPLTPELAESFGVRGTTGALIAAVVANSPAARAGLQVGDIVTEFDGVKVEGPADLQRAVGLTTPGHEARLRVRRRGAERTIVVTIGRAPDEQREAAPQEPRWRSLLHLDVQGITSEIARQLKLPSTEGVVVTSVEEQSAAAQAGIQLGDVIREINRRDVRDISDFQQAMRDVREGDRLTILVQRGAATFFVAFSVRGN